MGNANNEGIIGYFASQNECFKQGEIASSGPIGRYGVYRDIERLKNDVIRAGNNHNIQIVAVKVAKSDIITNCDKKFNIRKLRAMTVISVTNTTTTAPKFIPKRELIVA